MTDELIKESRARPSMGVSAALWVGLLLPPAVWAIQMQLNYWAVRGACVRASNFRLNLITLVAVILIVLSGLCAWLGGKRSTADARVEWGAVVSNSRFMMLLGVLMCAVFLAAVLTQGVAAVIFNPCQL